MNSKFEVNGVLFGLLSTMFFSASNVKVVSFEK